MNCVPRLGQALHGPLLRWEAGIGGQMWERNFVTAFLSHTPRSSGNTTTHLSHRKSKPHIINLQRNRVCGSTVRPACACRSGCNRQLPRWRQIDFGPAFSTGGPSVWKKTVDTKQRRSIQKEKIAISFCVACGRSSSSLAYDQNGWRVTQ